MLLGACVTNDRRHEGAPYRADFCDRNATHSGYYVSETIAEICRCGGATHASHGWPWKATQGLRGAGTAQRNAAAGASLVRQAPTDSRFPGGAEPTSDSGAAVFAPRPSTCAP